MITNYNKEGVTVLEPTGKIIGEAIPELRDVLRKKIDNTRRPRILLNLSRVRGIDSAGLGILLTAYTYTKQKDGRIGVMNIGKNIKNLIVQTRLVNVFEYFENEEAAITALSRRF